VLGPLVVLALQASVQPKCPASLADPGHQQPGDTSSTEQSNDIGPIRVPGHVYTRSLA